ncbi:Uncharacterised protein [uncultured archaeon]|nr:Uncharacterised protein [uncultured archaeon]
MSNDSFSRGQVFSIDFIVAMIVLVLCLAFITSYWNGTMSSTSQAIERNRLASSALVASDALLSGPGYPSDWENNASAVQSLGIARAGSPNEIDMAKLSNFTSLPYGKAKSLLGIRSEYHFMVEGVGSAASYESGNASYGESAFGITRFAVLEGKIVKVTFLVHG